MFGELWQEYWLGVASLGGQLSGRTPCASASGQAVVSLWVGIVEQLITCEQ